MEDAATLTKFASEVTLIHRRDKFRASQAMEKKVLANPKVKILWNTEVTKINGKEKVNGLSLRNNQTGKTSELATDGVFIAVGSKPNRELFPATAVPGVFPAGDAVDEHYKQAITAAGSGCMAAMDALEYLTCRKS
jgi:thioredoxin reductase (NADPH)